MNELTDKVYWEKYYSGGEVQKSQIEAVVSEFDPFWDFLIKNNDVNPPKSIIEIGGYPGRYLAYLSNKYNLEPTSLDYNSDRFKIDEVMKIFHISDYHVIQADIFNHVPEKQYDIVISNGFVEHFEDYDTILDKHAKYLKPGGTLFVLVPNMRNYIKYYKKLVDNENLKIHNLKSMRKKVFYDFGVRNNLKLLKLEYYGGFPFSVHQELNVIQKVIFKVHRIAFKFFLNKFLIKNPSKFFSSTLIAIYKK